MVHDIWWWCGLLFLLQWRHRVSYFESLGEYIDEVGFFEGKVVDLVANIRFIAVWRKAIRWVAFCPYFKDDHWLDTPIIIRLPIWAESNNANVPYGNFKGFPKNNTALFGARWHIMTPVPFTSSYRKIIQAWGKVQPCRQETGIIITATDVRNTKPHIDWQVRSCCKWSSLKD